MVSIGVFDESFCSGDVNTVENFLFSFQMSSNKYFGNLKGVQISNGSSKERCCRVPEFEWLQMYPNVVAMSRKGPVVG